MIDLLASSEQELIADTARGLFSEYFPLAELIGPAPAGYSKADGLAEAGRNGLIATHLPEQAGGPGYSIVEACLVMREAGRALAPLSLLAGAVGADVAAAAGLNDLARSIGSGEVAVALQVGHPGQAAAMFAGPPSASLAVAWNGDGVRLFELGEIIQPLESADPGEALSRRRAGTDVAGAGLVQAGAATLLSATMFSGIAEAARDSAVDYAKIRTQFGQPIGAFQAIKHICADMALRAEAAHFSVNLAALKSSAGMDDAALEVSAARIVAANAALANAAANIQVHGGIGFTSECEAHLFLKRANLLEQICGSNARFKSELGRARSAA